ncbi:hypothetical protein GCM10020256_56420 [Streptomyces thermocoprophilus]
MGEGAYVTPLVRKLAAENGVDLATVKGTGVGGRIRKQDVIAAAEAAKAAAAAPAPAAAAAPAARKAAPVLEVSPLRGQTVKMPRIRKVIGDNMVKALHEQAQLSSVVEVDVTRLMRLRAQAKDAFAAREGVKLSPMPFFVKAAAQALKAHPVINAKINEAEGTITYFDTENIGIAVDSEKGLMTPVIKNAGDLNIAGIAKATAELAARSAATRSPRTSCPARPSPSPTPVRAVRSSTRSSCRRARSRSSASAPRSSARPSSRRRRARSSASAT